MRQSAVDTVRAQAAQLLKTNLSSGTDKATGVQYRYLRPSPRAYRAQWFWDSCFHAIAFAHIDPDHSLAELRTLLAAQEDDGFIGHMTFWNSHALRIPNVWGWVQSGPGGRMRHTGLIQPPVLAQAVERVAEVLEDPTAAHEFMGPLDRYHNWLATNRAPGDDGLLIIVSPYESGMDQSPAHDEPLGVTPGSGRWKLWTRDRWLDVRSALAGHDSAKLIRSGRFVVKDAVVNALYADSLATMARLHRAQASGRIADAYAERARVVTASMSEKLWERGRGAFFNIYGPSDRRTTPLTVGGLVPLLLEGLTDEQADAIVERHLRNDEEYALPYPVPSVAATEPSFEPRGGAIWHGPTWVNTNWLLWRGLRRHGFDELAATLAARTVDMVAASGMREYYHPYTGQGMGAPSYGWSALALDMATA